MRLQFGLGTYQHRDTTLTQIQQNCYLEQNPLNAQNPVTLVGSYGTDDFSTPGNGPLRGGRTIKGVPYVVSGNSLYSIDSAGNETELGTIPNTDKVSIAGDGNNVMVTTAQEGYVWDGSTVEQITDADFPGADWVEYLDTYFIVGIGSTFYRSDPLAPKDWQALNFASAEASPDVIVGGIVEKRELFLGGGDSFEVWATDSSELGLSRIASGFVEEGLLTKFGLAKLDNTVFAVFTDFTVRRFEGFTPVVVSTAAVSQMIEDLVNKDSIYCSTFTESGHIMFCMTSDKWTLVFDTSTQLWHTRKSESLDYWRPFFFVRAFNSYLAGDRGSNKFGKLSGNTFTEWGSALTMRSSVQAVHSDGLPITGQYLELVFKSGVGTTGQGENPVVGMRQSFDGGVTWTAERYRSMGKMGKRRTRAKWSRMGQAEDRLIEFSISDPVRRSLKYANMPIEVGQP